MGGVEISAYAQESIKYPVILSSRVFHPTSSNDTLSTIKMVDLYHPDRIDWMYCTNAEQLAQLQARKIPYSLAINPQVPDSAGYTTKGRVVDINKKMFVASWMRNWKQKNANWGCVNSPEFKTVFYDQSHKLIDLGAYGLFVDDARFNDQTVEWGGCFCDYCMTSFTKYLQDNGADTLDYNFNYRRYLLSKGINSLPAKNRRVPLWDNFKAFQTQSVIEFLKRWRAEMELYAKRPISFLTNNYSGYWTEIYEVFDMGIGELPEGKANITFIKQQTDLARAKGKQQYFTLASDNEQEQLKLIFITYAANSSLVIPWDVYVHAKSKTAAVRYFGQINIFQPIYSLFNNKNQSLREKTITGKKRSDNKNLFKIESTSKGDSLHVTSYQITNTKIIQITAKPLNAIHQLIISTTNAAPIEAIFPNDAKIKNEGKLLKIQFEGELLLLKSKS